jgi:MoaA/NifB/PqqE/SkfB family radical SAM enzyme
VARRDDGARDQPHAGVSSDVARAIVEVGFKRVSISLDGPDASTHDRFRRVPGAFDAAVDGFIRLKERGISLLS